MVLTLTVQTNPHYFCLSRQKNVTFNLGFIKREINLLILHLINVFSLFIKYYI